MKKILNLLLMTLIVFSIAACSNDDDQNVAIAPSTITQYLRSNADYSSLVAALEKAGLINVLDGQDKFTLFAPGNAAFASFLSNNGFNALNDVPEAVLRQVLLNHVISGVNPSSALSTGYITTLATEATTSRNINMHVQLGTGVTLNGTVNVSRADIGLSNGIIHNVNNVIGLPSVVTFAVADSNFSTLVAALTREPDFNYVNVLSTNGTAPAPFTVFAPTNDAFGALLTELNISGLNAISKSVLQSTLNTHVIAGANVLSSQLRDNQTVNTLGDSFTINVTGGATFTDLNGRTGNIIVTDVQAANGVIHAIDKVILPKL